MTILAIDQGTTSTRALAVDADGSAAITSVIRHKQYYPQPEWVEHDPLELVRNIESALESVDNIAAVGIDNQGESCLAWHAETLEPVSQVIVWQDNRTGEAIEDLERNGVGEEIMNRAACPWIHTSRPASWHGSSTTFPKHANCRRRENSNWALRMRIFLIGSLEYSQRISQPPRAPR